MIIDFKGSVTSNYVHLSKIFGTIIAMTVPEIAIRIQIATAFHIRLECNISTFATIMLTKKEDRATSIIIVM